MNMNMLQQLQKLQKDLKKAQDKVAATLYEGSAISGAVKVGLFGTYRIEYIRVDDEFYKDADREMVQDSIKLAFDDALKQIEAANEEIAGSMKNIPGMPF